MSDLSERLRKRIQSHEELCEPSCECVDIVALREAAAALAEHDKLATANWVPNYLLEQAEARVSALQDDIKALKMANCLLHDNSRVTAQQLDEESASVSALQRENEELREQLAAIERIVPRRSESPDVPLVERVVQAVVQMQHDDGRCRMWEAECTSLREQLAAVQAQRPCGDCEWTLVTPCERHRAALSAQP